MWRLIGSVQSPIIWTFYHWQAKNFGQPQIETRGPWWTWITHLSHFPHKINSTFFVPIVPICKPQGGSQFLTPGASYEKHMIEVHYQMLLAKYQSSRPPSFRDEEFWSWSSLVLVPTCAPLGRASFDPRGIIWTNLVEVHKQMLHTKYQSSTPSSFRE